MTNYNLEEDKLLRIQIFLSVVFIFTIIVSISLSYNAMMECEGKTKLYTDEDAINILRINRIIAATISLGFLLINIYDKNLKENNNLNNNGADLQVFASIITVISSLTVLYVAFSNSSEIIESENPEI